MKTAGKKKITVGYVIQTFNDKNECTEQEFVAGDQVDYEDDQGEPIENFEVGQACDYQPFTMVQPQDMSVALVGNLSEGYGAVGPFADHDEAAAWGDCRETWIMTLQNPYTEFDEFGKKIPSVTIPVIGKMGKDGKVKFNV